MPSGSLRTRRTRRAGRGDAAGTGGARASRRASGTCGYSLSHAIDAVRYRRRVQLHRLARRARLLARTLGARGPHDGGVARRRRPLARRHGAPQSTVTLFLRELQLARTDAGFRERHGAPVQLVASTAVRFRKRHRRCRANPRFRHARLASRQPCRNARACPRAVSADPRAQTRVQAARLARGRRRGRRPPQARRAREAVLLRTLSLRPLKSNRPAFDRFACVARCRLSRALEDTVAPRHVAPRRRARPLCMHTH